MAIKKTTKGFEVDGIIFDSKEVAERYLKSLKTQEKADTGWLDEKIDYTFDPKSGQPSFRVFMEKIAQSKGLNLSQLAERIGKTRQTLYNWMDGKVIPDPASIDRICGAFGVSKDEVTIATLDNFTNAYPELVSKIREQSQDTGKMKLAVVLRTLSQELGPLDILDAGGDLALAMHWKQHSISLVFKADNVILVSLEPYKVDTGPSFEASSMDELKKVLANLKSSYFIK
jgi:transcriptional regulator with XRE-family HTH domain